MEAFFIILSIILLISQVAGQIYIVSFVLKKLKINGIILKIIFGVFIVIFLSAPGLIVSVMNPTTTHEQVNLPFSLLIIFGVWILSVSFVGFTLLIRDYWLLYKRKKMIA